MCSNNMAAKAVSRTIGNQVAEINYLVKRIGELEQ